MNLDLAHQTQLYLGLSERELYKYFRQLSADINTAIDVGAAEGIYTLYFLAKTPAKKVFAFEPDSAERAMLRTNLDMNSLAGDKRFELSAKYVGKWDIDSECTLDSLLPSISPSCLIKVDVEGGEVNVLQGASKLLSLPQIRWIIETHSKELEDQCIQLFSQVGYVTTIVPNAWWRLLIPELRYPRLHNRWLIAVKNSSR